MSSRCPEERGTRGEGRGVPPFAERCALAVPVVALALIVGVAHRHDVQRVAAGMFSVPTAEARPAIDAGVSSPLAPRPAALRVCSDPNNLPFSNAKEEGFENRIAELVARELGTRVEYTWWAQRRGYVRSTIKAGLCDVVIGTPSSMEMLLATRPYYRSSYVFVSRRSRHLGLRSFDDPRLKRLRIAVPVIGDDYANTPPMEALLRRDVPRAHILGLTVYGNYAEPNPPARIVETVVKGDADVAIVWGPLAGWVARHSAVPLDVVPVAPQVDVPFLPFVFDIAMGVRRGDTLTRARLDSVIVRRRAGIDSILHDFGVPRLDASQRRSTP